MCLHVEDFVSLDAEMGSVTFRTETLSTDTVKLLRSLCVDCKDMTPLVKYERVSKVLYEEIVRAEERTFLLPFVIL